MKTVWTAKKIEELKSLYPNEYNYNIVKILNISYGSIVNKAYLLGLKKSNEFKEKELKRQADRLRVVGISTRIKKGTIPPNKGMKMGSIIYEKCKATMFHKGNIPHNTKYNGYERINKEGYIEVRVSNGVFVLKHRKIWEEVYGQIPKGCNVRFINKNKTDLRIENLELVNKQKNMSLNSIHRYPQEVKEAIYLISKLNKTINEKQNY